MTTDLQLQNNEVASFEALKKETLAIAEACDQLTVTDDTSLAVATQNLSKANSCIKEIEKLRTDLKAPYFQAGKKIDELAKVLSGPLEKSLTAGKSKILAYNQQKELEARKEQHRILAVKEKIKNYSTNAIQAMKNSKTDEELIIAHNDWIKNFPVDTEWEEFSAEAHLMRTQLRDFASARRIEIRNPAEADTETAEVIKEQIAETVSEAGNAQIADAKFTTTTLFRGTWKFEMANKNEVPLAWLTLDETAVKMYMKTNKDNLKDGQVVNGVKFFVDKSVQIR